MSGSVAHGPARRLGFVGLGTMGGPMAANLLKAGHAVAAYDLDPARAAKLAGLGGRAAGSPADAARDAEVVITMLPDAPDVERAVLGPDGVAEGLRRGGVLVDMSTIDPGTTRRIGAALAERGIRMVDSPVGKTAEHAVTGTLTLMVGGERGVVEEVRPILACMGTDFFHCGGLGMGQAMKLSNNLLASIVGNANAEVLSAGIATGLTLELMLEVMRTTMAWNAQLATGMPRKPFRGDFSPGFMIRLARKDVRLAVEMERAAGVEPVMGGAAASVLDRAIAAGLGENDSGALLRLREQEAGVEVRLRDAAE